jgi:hypothetical protein
MKKEEESDEDFDLSDIEEEDQKKHQKFLTKMDDLDEMEWESKQERQKETKKLRVGFLDEFKHINSTQTLKLVRTVAEGKQAEKQGCGVLWYRGDGKVYYYSMTQNGIVADYINKHFDQYVIGGNSRQHFGDECHVHTEMFALYLQIELVGEEGVKKSGVIVSKRCCPVCSSVLAEFGVSILDDDPGDGSSSSYSTAWANPFIQAYIEFKEIPKKCQNASRRIDKVASAHAKKCKLTLSE